MPEQARSDGAGENQPAPSVFGKHAVFKHAKHTPSLAYGYTVAASVGAPLIGDVRTKRAAARLLDVRGKTRCPGSWS